MKNLRLLLLILPLALYLSSCDKIEPPYTVENIDPIDTTLFPIPDFPSDTHHVKTVLIEEYTGHNCPNCPLAAITAHDIVANDPEKAILIAIHAGYFAETESGNYSLDLNSTAGTELHAEMGITNNPAAVFNRKFISGTRIFESFTGWESTFVQVQDTVPLIDMQMIVNYNATVDKYGIHIQTQQLVDIDRALKIAVYVTEDSIVGYQRNMDAPAGPTPEITNYVFMNVMRGSVNGTWGSNLGNAAVTAGTKTISSFTFAPPALWVRDHCHIVAVVYDAETDEILQAVEQKMTP